MLGITIYVHHVFYSMELIVENMPKKPFIRAWEAIKKKLPEVKDIPNLKIYVVAEGKKMKLPLKNLPIELAYKFQKVIEGTDTSFSYSSDDQNFVLILIDPNTKFLLRNNLALRGLLAHEIMHTVQRMREYEDNIRDCFVKEFKRSLYFVSSLPFPTKKSIDLFTNIGKTAILVLKDLYSDSELIKKGFTRELLEYYSTLFGLGKFCPLPKFFHVEEGKEINVRDLKKLQDALEFELELLPAWLPFEKVNRTVAQKLKKHLERCYEQDIELIAREFHEVILLYITEFSMTCNFHRDFYRLILNKVYTVLGNIDQFSSHVTEAYEIARKKRGGGPERKLIASNILKSLYLHLKKRGDRKNLKLVLGEMKGVVDKDELIELKKSKIDKIELLKLPVYLSLKMARSEFLERPRSDFVDVAYACALAASGSSRNPLFSKTVVGLSRIVVDSPYDMVSDLLGLEFMFENDIFRTGPRPKAAERLMGAFKKNHVLPNNHTVSLAKSILTYTLSSKNKDPEVLALFYTTMLGKINVKDYPVVISALYAIKYPLGQIEEILTALRRLSAAP